MLRELWLTGPCRFSLNRGAGKVAGKVLIVDLHYRFANLLKSLETVTMWRLGQASNLIPGAPFSPSFLNKINDTSGLDHFSGTLLGPLGQIWLKSVS